MVYAALILLLRTPRLPAVDWADAQADLNGLVRFTEWRNLVSARVPSHFKRNLQILQLVFRLQFLWVYNTVYCGRLLPVFHRKYLHPTSCEPISQKSPLCFPCSLTCLIVRCCQPLLAVGIDLISWLLKWKVILLVLLIIILYMCGPGSSVGIATDYGLDRSGDQIQVGAGFSAPV
jgi:hypothetical protein